MRPRSLGGRSADATELLRMSFTLTLARGNRGVLQTQMTGITNIQTPRFALFILDSFQPSGICCMMMGVQIEYIGALLSLMQDCSAQLRPQHSSLAVCNILSIRMFPQN